MSPQDPEQRVDLPGALDFAPPPATHRAPPFWDYFDLGFLISLCLPALLIAVLLVRALSRTFPSGKPFQGLLAQLIWYALVFASLYGLLRLRYQRPFWQSLGWRVSLGSAAACLFIGPLLAFTIGFLGVVLRAPQIPLPFDQMAEDRPTLILFAIFVVVLGPLCEELAFRGFLMPLLMRSFGPTLGVVLTGVLFGSLHGPEYLWSWRHVLLVATAGTVFGWVRYKTGSTAAATFMHSTYNLTQLAGFLVQMSTR